MAEPSGQPPPPPWPNGFMHLSLVGTTTCGYARRAFGQLFAGMPLGLPASRLQNPPKEAHAELLAMVRRTRHAHTAYKRGPRFQRHGASGSTSVSWALKPGSFRNSERIT